MAALESTQARRAALLLHGLPPAARRQVLARLDAAEQARLQPLLHELVELGIPASTGTPRAELAQSPAAPLPAVDRAAVLSAEVVARCLQPCAAVTVARLLQSRAWPWKAAVLDQLPGTRHDAVVEWMRCETALLMPAVLECLCERLCTEAARLPAAHQEAKAGWRRLIEWTR